MKSIIKRTIYSGLGFLSKEADAVKNLGQELAKNAKVSEVEGEKIARMLRAKSTTAVKSVRRTLDAEVTMIAEALHAAINQHKATNQTKSTGTVKSPTRKKSRGKMISPARKSH